MIELPPGEPVASSNAPSESSTMVGDMDERGRLPGWTALGSRRPSSSRAVKEKSVSWLLRKNPPTIRPDPNGLSTVVVMGDDIAVRIHDHEMAGPRAVVGGVVGLLVSARRRTVGDGGNGLGGINQPGARGRDSRDPEAPSTRQRPQTP